MILATFWTSVLSIALIAISVLLIGLVLLQKNRGSGLSGAFGGVGGHSAFGTKTGDMLTWVTVCLATLFLVLNVAANFVFEPEPTVQAPPVAPPVAPIGESSPAPATATPATPSPKPIKITPTQVPPPAGVDASQGRPSGANPSEAQDTPNQKSAAPNPVNPKPAAPADSNTDPQQ